MSNNEENWQSSEYLVELPVDGSQDSSFLNMGIEFGPFGSNDKFRKSNLPEGWKLIRVGNIEYIVDLKERARAIIYIKNDIHMRPIARFNYGIDTYNPDENHNVRFCIWDHAVHYTKKARVIYEKIQALPSKREHPEVHNNRKSLYQREFNKEAEDWLSSNYADWSNVIKHWEEE